MKQLHTPTAGAVLLIGTALLTTPALAQDAPVAATPPPAQEAPAPAPEAVIPAPAPTITMAPQAPVVQPLPAEPEAQAAPRTEAETPAPAPRPAARQAARQSVARAAEPAPVAAAPAPRVAASPAPVVAAAPPPPAAAAPAPAAPIDAADQVEPATLSRAAPYWPWLLAGLVVLGAIVAWAALRRRRRAFADEYTEYEYADEPPAGEAPLATAAEPVVARPTAEAARPRRETSMAETSEARADPEDLAGIINGQAPVAHRPWLEFGLRPLRAGTSGEEALVELELTVANAGDEPARDVRIATFMLQPGQESEIEHMLVDPPADAAVRSASIAPGEGTRVDARLALLKDRLAGRNGFKPLVVADARYRLPDGREGRTTASFELGLTDAEGARFDPIALDARGMHETVAAQLHGTPEHV